MLDLNNNADPNNSPGPGYVLPADGNILIARKGPVTRLRTTGNLTASHAWQFDSVADQGWTSGDIVFLSLPAHTGAGFTVTVEGLAAVSSLVLATWAALLANGGMFIFNGTDFEGVLPGQSTT